ncbi:MAG: tRNA lysidine(34) synthetase TilS, partial [Halioglobus sp.]|nr:tRNA lysidine(34) synthetase TilS [Halioglobus sp.]
MSEAALHSAQLGPELADLQRAPHWYVGYSGGLDSTVLLHLLQQWRTANPRSPALTAIHVNHCLQSGADAWQAHCEHLCRELGVPLVSRAEPVRAGAQGIEAAARAVRYRIFERQLQAGAVLFLAHHLDDQVETFFLRLLRGAGLQGLAAMPARRSLGGGLLARPLLQRPRSQLEDYAREHQLRWVEDPSNTDTALDR